MSQLPFSLLSLKVGLVTKSFVLQISNHLEVSSRLINDVNKFGLKFIKYLVKSCLVKDFPHVSQQNPEKVSTMA